MAIMRDECAIGGNYSALLKIYFGKSGRSDGQWSNLENKLGALRWVLELNFNKKITASIFAIISQTFR